MKTWKTQGIEKLSDLRGKCEKFQFLSKIVENLGEILIYHLITNDNKFQ